MKFIDSTEIIVQAGRGGDGITTFKTARNKPKLGPDGGNGGNGADVVLCADTGNNTLSTVRYRQLYKAENGGKGAANNKTGKSGAPLYIALPMGTIIYEKESGEKLAEILTADDRVVIAKGGKRGYGNLSYLTSTRQAPRMSTEGKEGELKHLVFELKLLADVGLAGFPNAGKSTLLSVISSARPKIADYPFTTLTPNLGVVDVGDPTSNRSSFVVADVPGLIEGASKGKGLGTQFLQHLERCKLLVYLIDASQHEEECLLEKWEKLNHELKAYASSTLAEKDAIIALSKMDCVNDSSLLEPVLTKLRGTGYPVLTLSSLDKSGLKELTYTLSDKLLTLEKVQENNE